MGAAAAGQWVILTSDGNIARACAGSGW